MIVRFSIGALLTLAVLIITGAIVKIMLDTSVLLKLVGISPLRKVWMDAWSFLQVNPPQMVLPPPPPEGRTDGDRFGRHCARGEGD